MLKKAITYIDLDEKEQTEEFYFHLTQADILKLELGHAQQGGLEQSMRRMMVANDGKAIIEEFENILKISFGRRSADGKKFERSEELWAEFYGTEAYSALFMEICTDADKMVAFIQGIVPKAMLEDANRLAAQQVLPDLKVQEKITDPEIVQRSSLETMPREEFVALAERIATGEVVIVD